MKTITTPQSWADINLYQYLRWYRAVKPYLETEEYADKAILHGIFNFTNITEDEYLNMPEKNITDLRIQIEKLLNTTYTNFLPKSISTNKDRVELFNLYLTIDCVFGAISFFLDLQRDLLIGTQTYLQEMLKKVGKKGSPLQMALAQNGADSTQLQYLQEMISSNLTALRSFPFTNV